ncbi:hypothetical protein H5410_063193 [Solanum commersonii]|uniref:Uncharacterized protein n=1 Tax=Solanum commersonii TaxID=4109 RepID=A0A9J5WCJ8_SOLCO|nr:hypothetical protein H5410_063193 [Solanum commersonii]
MLQTLLNSCPLIVSFVLKHCWGLKNIELLNLQKIKSISITAIVEALQWSCHPRRLYLSTIVEMTKRFINYLMAIQIDSRACLATYMDLWHVIVLLSIRIPYNLELIPHRLKVSKQHTELKKMTVTTLAS